LRSHIEESQRRGEDRIEEPIVNGSSRSDSSVLPDSDHEEEKPNSVRELKVNTDVKTYLESRCSRI
jgi:hypothetical protein